MALLGVLAVAGGCASNTKQAANVDAKSTASQAPSIVPGSQADLDQSAGDRVYFAYDQYALTEQARDTLSKQAAWLQKYPAVRIVIAGNCDERGTREYNLALGGRRAQAARAYLESRGIASGRMTTVSYGKERPIDNGRDEAAWSRNRNAFTMIAGASS